jgi:hypothetical protein
MPLGQNTIPVQGLRLLRPVSRSACQDRSGVRLALRASWIEERDDTERLTDFSSGGLSSIYQLGGARSMQVALKLYF